MRKSQGYTVIELLVAVVLLSIIAMTGTVLLFTSLGTSAKATSLALVKQSGDYAVSIIERLVRESQTAQCLSGDTVLVLTQAVDDGQITRTIQLDSDQLIYVENDGGIAVTHRVTGDEITARLFSCRVTKGISQAPDVVLTRFNLALNSGGRPSESISQDFQTRVTLRTY